MTFYYSTRTWNSQPQLTEETINLWKHLADKKNWRIVQLANGFYQTEYQSPEDEDTWIDVTRRETIEGAETAIEQHWRLYSSFPNPRSKSSWCKTCY